MFSHNFRSYTLCVVVLSVKTSAMCFRKLLELL